MESKHEKQEDVVQLFKAECWKLLDSLELIKRMEVSGYAVSQEGVCAGITGMSMQNWLLSRLEGISQFKKRIDFTLSIPVGEFEKATQKNLFLGSNVSPHFFSKAPVGEQTYDIDALFDGIQSYQEDRLLTSSTDKRGRQSPLLTAPFLLSKELQKKGNLVLAGSEIDAYQNSELIVYLEKLKNIQKMHPNQNLAFRLVSGNHAVFLGYDCNTDVWALVDANSLDELFFTDTQKIAERIIGGFSPNKLSDFSFTKIMEERLETDLKDLQVQLQLIKKPIYFELFGSFEVLYYPDKNQFVLEDPKPEQYALFETEIYTLSAIHILLEAHLQTLLSEYETQASEDQPLQIELRHLEQQIKVQYQSLTKTWILLNEDNTPCGKTQKTEELTQWIMSEFLTSTNRSVLQIEVHSNLNPLQQISIQDPDLSALQADLAAVPREAIINQEKALRCDTYGHSFLYLAAKYGHLQTVIQLLNAGVDVNQSSNKIDSALYQAADQGWEEIVSLLISSGAKDDSAFIRAVYNGHKEVVHLFLKNGIDVNEQGDADTTALIAATKTNNLEMLEFLFQHGAIHKADKKGFTPMVTAAFDGHIDALLFLLSKGVSINESDNRGVTPLVIAAQNGHLKLMEYLFSKGALNIKDRRGFSPLMSASLTGEAEVVAFLLTRKDTLIHEGNGKGRTPLHLAAEQGNLAVVKLLLEQGATNIGDNEDISPVDLAQHFGHMEIVDLILESEQNLKLKGAP